MGRVRARRRGRRGAEVVLAGLLAGAVPGPGAAATCAADLWPLQDAPELRPAAPPLLEIGSEDDPAYQFASVTAVRLLDDGRVVVADAGAREIRVFASGGAHLVTLGGPGDGPGEFRSLDGMWTVGGAEIGAWDAESQRITTFDAKALESPARTARLEIPVQSGLGSPPQAFLGAFSGGDVLLASLAFGGPPSPAPVADRWFLGRFRSDGSFRELLGEARGMRRLRGFPLPFGPLPRVAVARDSVFLADGYEARISILAPGRGSGGEDLLLPPRAETLRAAEVWDSLRGSLEAQGGTLFLERMEDMPLPEAFPEVGGMLPAREPGEGWSGSVWVRRYDPFVDSAWLAGPLRPGAGGEWLLLDAGGAVSAVLRLPSAFIPMHIAGGRIAGVLIDALGVERVAVHSLESN